MSPLLTCPKCRALLEPKMRTCPYCGTSQAAGRAPSPAREAEATGRLGLWILAVNVLLFLLVLAFDPAKNDRQDNFTPTYQAQIIFGANHWPSVKLCGEYWRFVTAMFLHVDLLHLVLNSVALLILIPLAAATFGARRTTCVYFGAGLVASCVSHLSHTSSVGASGALCGLIAALAVYGLRRGGFEGRLLTRRMVGWALFIVVIGMLWPGVDNWGHLGGFAGGALVGRFGAGVRVHGGRAEAAWMWGARLCLAVGLTVALVWMAPSVWRGFQRREVEVYQSYVRRTLNRVTGVLEGQAGVELPERFEEGPRGSGEVHAAVVRALEAARGKGPDAFFALRAAYKEVLAWEKGFYCRYGIR
ncbi:MAG: rhomboid family intramembrane serine protease [Planctomycetota bacterium]